MRGDRRGGTLGPDLDRIRAALDMGYDECHAWFSLDEAHTPFAPHKSPGHRALLLTRWTAGPAAWVMARSTSSSTGLEHDPHDHQSEFPRCWLTAPARIVTGKPFTVRRSLLNAATYMCAEQHADASAGVAACACPP